MITWHGSSIEINSKLSNYHMHFRLDLKSKDAEVSCHCGRTYKFNLEESVRYQCSCGCYWSITPILIVDTFCYYHDELLFTFEPCAEAKKINLEMMNLEKEVEQRRMESFSKIPVSKKKREFEAESWAKEIGLDRDDTLLPSRKILYDPRYDPFYKNKPYGPLRPTDYGTFTDLLGREFEPEYIGHHVRLKPKKRYY